MWIWIIKFGDCTMRFYTEYHAEQQARALRLNGTLFTMTKI